jgi:hypothetical protein
MSAFLLKKPRIALRFELVEAYAHCTDRGDAKGQMALFTSDARFVGYMNAKDPTPSQELHSRDALAPVFAELSKYDSTTHFVGQSTIFTLTADRATGEAYLPGAPRHNQRREANVDGRVTALSGYFPKDRRRPAVFRA